MNTGLRERISLWQESMLTKKEKRLCETRRDNLLAFIEDTKCIDYKDPQTIREFYFKCLSWRNLGVYYPLDKFKEWFPKMFHDLQAILNKRTLIKRDVKILKSVSHRVVFGTLTFSDDNYKDNEKNMLKKAQRYLDKTLSAYEIIEEYGEENNRYHIHFLGIMRDNLTYIEFFNGWEDRAQIESVKSGKRDTQKVAKYLCDYVVKQVPKIRRNRLMTQLVKKYQDYTKSLEFNQVESDLQWLEIQKLLDIDQELPF